MEPERPRDLARREPPRDMGRMEPQRDNGMPGSGHKEPRRGSVLNERRGSGQKDPRRSPTAIEYRPGSSKSDKALMSTSSQSTLGNLSIPNAGYILGNRLYEQRNHFQNVLGSNPDISQMDEPQRPQRPLALPATQPAPLTRDRVKTLNNFSHSAALQPIATTSFVPVIEGKSEPNIPYQQMPPSSNRTSNTEYQIESVTRSEYNNNNQSETCQTPYMGPASERSAKLRPISAGSGHSDGLCLEAPEDNAETETVHEYEMTIPETEPGNEEDFHFTEDQRDPDTVGEHEHGRFMDEECDEGNALVRSDESVHDDNLDEVSRPQAGNDEEIEYEDYEMQDGRKSVEIEGEDEYVLEDHPDDVIEEMNNGQMPQFEQEQDGELEEMMRGQESEDEEAFERPITPNWQANDYLRDDLSSTSLVRPDSPEGIDERMDPELNGLTLDSPHRMDDDECGELTLKEVIRDAFDTPYLRDYQHQATGETDSESGTEYEFCNESEDEIEVEQDESDEDDDGEG